MSRDGCFFIVNPNAAGGRLGRAWPRLADKIKGALGAFDSALTRGPGDASRLAAEAARDGYEVVVSVGGDGTHNEVVNGLIKDDASINPDTALGVLPFGTGGDFRRSLHPRLNIERALTLLREGRDQPLDIGRIDFVRDDGEEAHRYFVNIASLGISGVIDRITNRSSKCLGGTLTFAIASLQAFGEYSPPKVEIQIDDGPWLTCPIFSIAVANGQYFGGGMHIAPEAQLDDGLFDVIVIRELPKSALLRHGLNVYRGRHTDNPWVTSFRGARVTARSKKTVLLDIDGEAPGKLPATFQMLPGALKLRRS